MIVVVRRPDLFDEPFAQDTESVVGGSRGVAAESGETVVDAVLPGLDEPVGVQEQGRAGRQVDAVPSPADAGAGAGAGAQEHTVRSVQVFGAAVVGEQQGRRMADVGPLPDPSRFAKRRQGGPERGWPWPGRWRAPSPGRADRPRWAGAARTMPGHGACCAAAPCGRPPPDRGRMTSPMTRPIVPSRSGNASYQSRPTCETSGAGR